MTNETLLITEDYDGMRIDAALADLFPDRSRSFLQKLIKDGAVQCNEKGIAPSYKVHTDDSVTLCIPDNVSLNIEAEDIPLEVLYEDQDLLVVNKPKDMVVHPAPGHYSHTLVNALLYYCKGSLSGINGVLRPGIVHRIDKDTTGSLIVCKTNAAHLKMADLLTEHNLVRRYRCIVEGTFKEKSGIIETTIGRNPNDRLKMAINVPNGKPAKTEYRVLSENGAYSYVECTLYTGRTHQIRVHMASKQHPIVGDPLYGSGRPNAAYKALQVQGQVLHAYYLSFEHPITGEKLEIIAPIPEYFKKLLQEYRLDIISE